MYAIYLLFFANNACANANKSFFFYLEQHISSVIPILKVNIYLINYHNDFMCILMQRKTETNLVRKKKYRAIFKIKSKSNKRRIKTAKKKRRKKLMNFTLILS